MFDGGDFFNMIYSDVFCNKLQSLMKHSPLSEKETTACLRPQILALTNLARAPTTRGVVIPATQMDTHPVFYSKQTKILS